MNSVDKSQRVLKLENARESAVENAGENSQLDHARIAHGLSQIKQLFNSLRKDNVAEVRDYYTKDVVFIDPFVEIRGVDNLVQHLANQYANLDSCTFDYGEQFIDAEKATLSWSMSVRHPALANSKEILVDGMTLFVFEGDQISFQRDYYDAGAMLYEHVPVIGTVIRKIRKRLQ